MREAVDAMKEGGVLLGSASSEQIVKDFMASVDKDQDGKVDLNEFMRMTDRAQHKAANVVSNQFLLLTNAARNIVMNTQDQVKKNRVGNDLWMINPIGPFHVVWDILVSLGSIFLVFTLPISLGWTQFGTNFKVVNILLEILFMFDVVLNFFTGYIRDDEVIVLDCKEARRHYLRTYFIPDLISSYPFDITFKLVRGSFKCARPYCGCYRLTGRHLGKSNEG